MLILRQKRLSPQAIIFLFVGILLLVKSSVVLSEEGTEEEKYKAVVCWNVVFYFSDHSAGEQTTIKTKVEEFKRVLIEQKEQLGAEYLFFSPFESEERLATYANLQTLLKLFAYPDEDIIGPNGTRLAKLRDDDSQKIELRFFLCGTTEEGKLFFPNETSTMYVDDSFWKKINGIDEERGASLDFVAIFSCLHNKGKDRTSNSSRPLESRNIESPRPIDLHGKTFGFVSNNSVDAAAYFTALIDVFHGKADGNDGSSRDGIVYVDEALRYVSNYQHYTLSDEINIIFSGEPYVFIEGFKESTVDTKLLAELVKQLKILKSSKNTNINETLLKEAERRILGNSASTN